MFFVLQRNMVREGTVFLLDALAGDKPEEAALQTKVLEINLVTNPQVGDGAAGDAQGHTGSVCAVMLSEWWCAHAAGPVFLGLWTRLACVQLQLTRGLHTARDWLAYPRLRCHALNLAAALIGLLVCRRCCSLLASSLLTLPLAPTN